MRRPAFFLSSTIYDLKDLRSALKYYLESLGCTVLASEFNDFQKPLEMHSYEACLRTIADADYFILLIGARVGGWFDKDSRISITQREYREALNLQQSSGPRILTFVRAEVWQLRQERRELQKYLESLHMASELAESISNYPSKFASDAAFIADFISEVARTEETRRAVDTSTPLPAGNWVHVFHDFRGIIDVLQTFAFAKMPVDEAAMRRLLRLEILEILRRCLIRIAGKAYSLHEVVEKFGNTYRDKIELGGELSVTVDVEDLDRLASVALHLLGKKLQPIQIPNALTSRCFLEFDRPSGQFTETPVYRALFALQEEIKSFTLANIPDTFAIISANAPVARPPGTKAVKAQTVQLVVLLHLLDRWLNIIALSVALARHLRGGPFVMPAMRPRSPFRGLDAELAEEELRDDELEEFIGN